jgi:putative ATPase
MRPTGLDEMVGQEALVGPTGFLRRAIAEDRIPSLILWGPAGTGKTTLARIVASSTSSRFVPFSAVTSGIKEVKQVMQDAARYRRAEGRRTLLFVDEIHRFNRAQQDAFLPYVEAGDIVLVGATTENPSFELNSALLSRCKVVVLAPLADEDLVRILERALGDAERGLGRSKVVFDSAALATLARLAAGDARRALNLLELVLQDAEAQGVARVGAQGVEHVVQHRVALYDKSGEEHFNLISALHKSVRESDPDAALYWLARMLAGGEQPDYLARRLVRIAAEDIGLADPQAVSRAIAGWQAWERLGTPEGELALAQLVVDLALSPKSNAVYKAWGAARAAAADTAAAPVPMAIRNAPTKLLEELGYGAGYVYAPDTAEGVGGLECLPEALAGSRFYRPRGEGFEAELASRLERFRELRERARGSQE